MPASFGDVEFFTIIRAPDTQQHEVLHVTGKTIGHFHGQLGEDKGVRVRSRQCKGKFDDLKTAMSVCEKVREADAPLYEEIKEARDRYDSACAKRRFALNAIIQTAMAERAKA